jgi:hypothetical protein
MLPARCRALKINQSCKDRCWQHFVPKRWLFCDADGHVAGIKMGSEPILSTGCASGDNSLPKPSIVQSVISLTECVRAVALMRLIASEKIEND